MKNFKLSLVLGMIAGLILLYSFSSNPLNGRTGPPCDINLCADCHIGSSTVDGNMSISGIPDTVNPGTTYEIEIKLVNPNFQAGRGGFQMTAVNSSNTGTGNFSSSHPNTTVQPSGTRQYLEHDVALSFPGSGSNEILYAGDWTAPDGPIGDIITFCAAGNIANGNGNSSGDKIVQTSFNVSLEALTSSVNDELSLAITTYPNPFKDYIRLDFSGNESKVKYVMIRDNFGNLVFHRSRAIHVPVLYIASTQYPPGLYFVRVITESKKWTEKLIKF